jgi:hypothetical protein
MVGSVPFPVSLSIMFVGMIYSENLDGNNFGRNMLECDIYLFAFISFHISFTGSSDGNHSCYGAPEIKLS